MPDQQPQVCGHQSHKGKCDIKMGHAGPHLKVTQQDVIDGEVHVKSVMWDDAGKFINEQFNDTAYIGKA